MVKENKSSDANRGPTINPESNQKLTKRNIVGEVDNDRLLVFDSKEEHRAFYDAVSDSVDGKEYAPTFEGLINAGAKRFGDTLVIPVRGVGTVRRRNHFNREVHTKDEFIDVVKNTMIYYDKDFNESKIPELNLGPLIKELDKIILDEIKKDASRKVGHIILSQIAFICGTAACYKQAHSFESEYKKRMKAVEKTVDSLFKLNMVHESSWARYQFWKNVQHFAHEENKLSPRKSRYLVFNHPIRMLLRYLPINTIRELLITIFTELSKLEVIFNVTDGKKKIKAIERRLEEHISNQKAYTDQETKSLIQVKIVI
jgi:hypothetical protein